MCLCGCDRGENPSHLVPPLDCQLGIDKGFQWWYRHNFLSKEHNPSMLGQDGIAKVASEGFKAGVKFILNHIKHNQEIDTDKG